MGAETTYRVKILCLVEDWVEVSAIGHTDAEDKALRIPGVAKVVEVRHAGLDEESLDT